MSAPPAQFPYIVTGCATPCKFLCGHGISANDEPTFLDNGQDTWPRREINDLVKDEYQFSLFIQAMKNLQAEGYTPVPASWKEVGTFS